MTEPLHISPLLDSAITRPFKPRAIMRHHLLQSVLASFKPRRWLSKRLRPALERCAKDVTIDCGDNVRLHGMLSQHEKSASKGLVVLIHGWEGSASSVYLHSAANNLFRDGFDVFRLHLRDHGPTHHLNEEAFHSCRLDEVYNAVKFAAEAYGNGTTALAGFSLGGNFILRVGIEAERRGECFINRLIAISPPIDPKIAIDAIIEGPPIYHKHFVLAYREGAEAKQAAWPQRWNFDDAMQETSISDVLVHFVRQVTPYDEVDTYLHAYGVDKVALQNIKTPTLVISAQDDLVIPFESFLSLENTESLEVYLPRHGGHCGFMQWPWKSWLSPIMRSTLNTDLAQEPVTIRTA